jgi:hypothetical protein
MTQALMAMTKRAWFPTAIAIAVGALAYGPGWKINIAGEDPKFYPIEILGAVAIIVAILAYRKGSAKPVPLTTVTGLALWIILVVASILGIGPLLSIGIARVSVLAAGIAWAVPALTETHDRWRLVSIAVIAGTLVHSYRLIDSLVTLTGGEIKVWIQIRDGVRLLGGSLNAATSILVVSIPFLLVAIVRQKGWVRWLAAVSVIVSVGLIAESQSRSVALAMYAAIAAWAVALVIRSDRTKYIPVLIGGVAIVLGFWFGPGGGGTVIVGIINPIVPGLGSGDPVLDEDFPFDSLDPPIDSEGDWERRNNWSDLHRSQLWDAALDDFKDNPIIGSGFRERQVEGEDGVAGFAHNTFLELLAATGLLGTLAFVAAWLAYGLAWLRDWRSWQFEKVALAGTILSGFAIGMVQPFFLTGHVFAVLIWLAAAVAIKPHGALEEAELA